MTGAIVKQATAALDNSDNRVLLACPGQIQQLDGKFHLTGSPAYAEYMDWAPFHGRCLTAIVLYDPVFDDGLTEAAVDQILTDRAAGMRGLQNWAQLHAR